MNRVRRVLSRWDKHVRHSLFGHGVGPVAMEHAEVKFLLIREMGHTGHERLPERPVLGQFGKDFVDGCVVNGWLAVGVVRNGQALPLHSSIQHPQDNTFPQI